MPPSSSLLSLRRQSWRDLQRETAGVPPPLSSAGGFPSRNTALLRRRPDLNNRGAVLTEVRRLCLAGFSRRVPCYSDHYPIHFGRFLSPMLSKCTSFLYVSSLSFSLSLMFFLSLGLFIFGLRESFRSETFSIITFI